MTDPVSKMPNLRSSEPATANVVRSEIPSSPQPARSDTDDDTFFAGDHPGDREILDTPPVTPSLTRPSESRVGTWGTHFGDAPNRPRASSADAPMNSLVLHQENGLSHALRLHNLPGQAYPDHPSVLEIPGFACIAGIQRNDRWTVRRTIRGGAFVCVTTMNLMKLADAPRDQIFRLVRALEGKKFACHYRYIAPLGVLDAIVSAGSHVWHGCAGPTTVRASAVAFIAAKAREDYWGRPRHNAASVAILRAASLKTFDDIIRLGAIPSFSEKSLKEFFSASVSRMVESSSAMERSELRDNLAESVARLAWAVGKKTGNMRVLKDLMEVQGAPPRILGARLGVALSVASYMDKLKKEKSADQEFYISLGASVVKAAVGSVPFAGPALGELVSVLEKVTNKCLEEKSSASVMAQKMKNTICDVIAHGNDAAGGAVTGWKQQDYQDMLNAISTHQVSYSS